MSTFGERLKRLRDVKGLSQEELGKRFNLSQSTIAYYELNKKQPSQNTLNKMADFFDVSTDYLLARSDETRDEDKNIVIVAGNEIELTTEEFEVFNEIRKNKVMFHDLATNPEKKVKQLIKIWEFIKKDLENDEDDGEGFGELED